VKEVVELLDVVLLREHAQTLPILVVGENKFMNSRKIIVFWVEKRRLLLLPYLAICEKGFDIVVGELIVHNKLLGDLADLSASRAARQSVKVRIHEQHLLTSGGRGGLAVERVDEELAAAAGRRLSILRIRPRLIFIHNFDFFLSVCFGFC
jgi:hypothetical protein